MWLGKASKALSQRCWEMISKAEPNVGILANRLGLRAASALRGASTSPIDILTETENRGLISRRNFKKLGGVSERDEALRFYVRSYEGKWCDDWLYENLDSLFAETMQRNKSSGAERLHRGTHLLMG